MIGQSKIQLSDGSWQHASHSEDEGWRVWGKVLAVDETATRPAISLFAEYDNHTINANQQSDDSQFHAIAKYQAVGGQLLVSRKFYRHTSLHGRAGIYTTEMNDGNTLSTVQLLGGGVSTMLNQRTSLHLFVTGYHDTYYENRVSGDIQAIAIIRPSTRLNFTLSGTFFLHGAPYAATPLSAMSAMGALYAGGLPIYDRLQHGMTGYLSVCSSYSY
ncbi:MAG: hypothetical protein ACYDBB_10505 [Armatimonadota bacterium]